MRTSKIWIVVAAFALLVAGAHPAASQSGTVGIYTDASGTTCSFSGNDPGIVKAYVVVRPGADGFRGVRFSAPVPACFGGSFLGEEVPPDLFSVGNSQTGISIAGATCGSFPLHVLSISYYRTTSTDPCCPYPVLAEPGFPAVQAVNCDGVEVWWSGLTSRFNADESCPCSVGVAPDAPSQPHPLDGADGIIVTTALSWFSQDFDGDLGDFDVYLGTDASPPLVAQHVSEQMYQPAMLEPLTTYYWRVVARDLAGHETNGPTWMFTTRLTNSPPEGAYPVSPTDAEVVGTQTSTVSARLEWHSFDIDNDVLTYDLYFGSTVPPPLLATDLLFPFRGVGSLALDNTYYWQVVTHDLHGHTSTSPVWHFSTKQFKSTIEWVPDPPNNQTGVPANATLSWAPFVSDVGAATYEVYFGEYDPQRVPVATVFTNSYTPPNGFQTDHLYSWYIIAYIGGGRSIAWGPQWSFATGATPVNTPAHPTPAYNAVLNDSPTLQWDIDNPTGQPLTFQVYFDGQLLGTTAQRSWPLSNLTANKRYYWSVWPILGNVATPGPTWTFKIQPADVQPPANPVPPNDGASALVASLSWSPINPQGGPAPAQVFFSQSDPPVFYGLTTASTYQIANPLTPGQRYYWRVTGADPSAPPGPVWNFVAQSGPVAVLFSHFEAATIADGIRVSWELQSDEALDSYTLYRSEGVASTPVAIAQGRVTGVSGEFVDRTANGGTRYQYELAIQTTDGDLFRSPKAAATAPALVLALYQNQPNPFNPETTIRYDLPGGSGRTRVRLGVYDVAGRRVRELVNEEKPSGRYSAVWNGKDDRGTSVASGVYFYRLDVAGQKLTRKLVLLK